MSPWNRLVLRSALIFVPLLAIGCGGNENLATVSGTVTLDGKPLPNAFITFIPQGGVGSTSYGRTDADGEYEMMFSDNQAGAWIGENLVRISTADVGLTPDQKVPEIVPAIYNDKSDLVRMVASGGNEFDFKLESDTGNIVQPGL